MSDMSDKYPTSPSKQKKGTMTRSRATAKQAGAKTERHVADYLAATLADDRIDRRVKTGAKDRGDIAGLRHHGHRLVVEVKDCAKQDLPGWTNEAHVEACNDDALAGFVVAKRRGTTDPGRFWVHMTVDDLLALLTLERHGHRKDIA
jgi:hypothetical protein